MAPPSMNPDRWSTVKNLFEAALSMQPAERGPFLDRQCGDDPELRREVDSLLEAHSGAGEFLDHLPEAPKEEEPVNDRDLIGQALGPYHVLEMIGEGGMGAIYLARDERLKRKVAIKTLRAQHAWDSEMIARLRLEARAESSINHPNICTVFDVGEWKGRPYIVMEYLQGTPLRSRMTGRPMAVEETLEIGIQVASALEAAHAKGIIHRDVKPANIFLTADGPVKVMDFGVAKKIVQKIQEDERTPDQLTNPWIRVGTAPNMSPEQTRGGAIDGRSDLFSLGSVLYEMATGMAPFRADSPRKVMDAIANVEPAPPSNVNPAIPPDLERIILKALEKDPGLRYQTAGDFVADLKRLRRDTSSGRIPVPPEPRGAKRWWWAVGAAAVLLAVVGAVAMRDGDTRPSPRLMSLSSLRGIKENPAISVDGGRVAFSWTGDSGAATDKEIYLQMIGSGPPLKLTDGPGKAESPVWSPDGRQIAFLRTGSGEPGYFAVSALGGLERKLAPALDPPPRAGGAPFDWSPDGKHLAIADRLVRNGPRLLLLHDLANGTRRQLGSEAAYVANPAFSPTGDAIAFTMGPSFLSHDIHVIPAGGGQARRITSDGRWIAGLTWSSDGTTIVFSTRKSGPFTLWSVPARGGVAEPLALSGTDVYSPNFARQGSRMVFARHKITRNLWRLKLGSSEPARELIGSTRSSFQPDYSPDGGRIAFASDRTSAFEIWVADSEGRHPLQITSFRGPQTGSPHWSPDGRWIAFDSRPDGHADIYVINSGGGEPRRLTREASEDRSPWWSADGKWIYFTSNREGGNQLWRISFEGGAAEAVTTDGAISAAEYGARGEIYYANLRGLWKRRSGWEGQPTRLAEKFPFVGWIHANGRLYYGRTDEKGLQEIVSFSPQDGTTAVVARLNHSSSDFDTFTISPDGQWLLFDRIDQVENEILLIENAR
ncbi:MAG: protein kinase [Bryobacteraceae bacterium]|nr:protein kinase [Bryobacteraceae bacterium]